MSQHDIKTALHKMEIIKKAIDDNQTRQKANIDEITSLLNEMIAEHKCKCPDPAACKITGNCASLGKSLINEEGYTRIIIGE